MRKLEIGSGNHPQEGYEHLDINPSFPHLEYVSSMEKIPVEDNSFDKIKSVHSIEHQDWFKITETLREWVRVLKPNGEAWIGTPNFRWIAKTYIEAINGNRSEMERDLEAFNEDQKSLLTINGYVNPTLWANFKILSPGGKNNHHYICFDGKTLEYFMKQAGFRKIEVIHDSESLIVKGWK